MEEIVTVDADADANAQGIDPMKHGNLLYTTPGICYDSFHSDPSAPPGPDKSLGNDNLNELGAHLDSEFSNLSTEVKEIDTTLSPCQINNYSVLQQQQQQSLIGFDIFWPASQNLNSELLQYPLPASSSRLEEHDPAHQGTEWTAEFGNIQNLGSISHKSLGDQEFIHDFRRISPTGLDESFEQNADKLPHDIGHTWSWSNPTSLHSSVESNTIWPINEPRNREPSHSASSHATQNVVAPRLSKGLPRRRSIYRFQRSGPRTAPIFIPNALPGYPDRHETLDPMQRWQQSPPEDEPASLSAIHNAIRNASNVEPNLDRRPSQQGSGSLDSFRSYARAASTTSFDSRSTSSKQSLSSAHSAASEEGFGALRHKRHGRVSKSRCKRGDKMKERRRFQCTFCCDTFRTKYDWARHEKSLHMYLEEWVCAPHGNSIFSPASGRIHCAFCNALDPSPEHLDAHNYKSCRSESTLPRSFKRKDHLVQHLQLTHKLETIPNIEDWKVKAPDIASRCGFCNLHLSNWQNRADHLAAHFRQGSTMDDWHGEHGFEPSIAAKVVNALPTYLIGPESRSLVPFSATSPGCKDHFAQITSRLDTAENVPRGTDSLAAMSSLEEPRVNLSQLDTFGKVLTLHLGQYAREQMTKGVLPTDDMFQREARKVLFDCEDSWNQTIVDNPEWMASFRRQHGWENSNTEPERSASSFER